MKMKVWRWGFPSWSLPSWWIHCRRCGHTWEYTTWAVAQLGADFHGRACTRDHRAAVAADPADTTR